MALSKHDNASVRRIERMGLTVSNLRAAERFYVEALGFETTRLQTYAGEAFAALTGLDGARVQAALLRLGDQTLELAQFTEPGAPYPEPRAANDPWFQHFAIAVGDMNAAFARLSIFDPQPISRGGPQRLPPSTGDVIAYKFRDPDGHPLELSYAPRSAWSAQATPTSHATLGIDHSALAVKDLEVSVRFYTEGLGFRLGAPALNRGPEQARLDGLDDPVVDIATLTTPDVGPHLELLHYRTPTSSAARRPVRVDDIAATRLTMRTDAFDRLADQALAAGASQVSRGIVATPVARKLWLRDPDGHLLEICDADD